MTIERIKYKGYEIDKRFNDNNNKLLAIRIYTTPEESEFITFYLNGNLWIKHNLIVNSEKIYSINILSPILKEIIRDFDYNNTINKRGDLKLQELI